MAEPQYFSCKENWKKPDKSIKLIVKKKVQKQGEKASVLLARNVNGTHSEGMRTQVKRHNPFSCSPRKKANISRAAKIQENVKLFNDLDKLGSSSKTDTINESHVNTIKVSQVTEYLDKKVKPQTELTKEINTVTSKTLPLDWSLKTRVRFTSCQPFTWCSKLLCNQETEGICNYVQVRETTTNNNNACQSSDSSVFQQNIMYWAHPVFPWLSLFPRLSSETKLTSKLPSLAENTEIAEALQSSWSQSFRSLFNLVRCGRCDYFYLCSSQSTMLFRAAKIGGLPSVSVLITPTTKGIRDAFDKEGIAYILPLLHQSKQQNYDEDNDENDQDHINHTELDDNTEWLESMGVGKETLPQLQQSKIKQERAQLRNIDHHGSSIAIITGSDTQGLFNYLLNCKSLIAKTGNLVGVPPTLLAPVAFEGATLQSLSAKQGIIKQGKHLEQRYNLDVSGPILPGMFLKLCKVFEKTQDNQFTAATKLLQTTTPFNVVPSKTKDEPPIMETKLNYFEQCSDLNTTGLTHVKYEHGLYSWETT